MSEQDNEAAQATAVIDHAAPANGDYAPDVAERLKAIHEFTLAAQQLEMPPHDGTWSREEIYDGDIERILGLKGGA